MLDFLNKYGEIHIHQPHSLGIGESKSQTAKLNQRSTKFRRLEELETLLWRYFIQNMDVFGIKLQFFTVLFRSHGKYGKQHAQPTELSARVPYLSTVYRYTAVFVMYTVALTWKCPWRSWWNSRPLPATWAGEEGPPQRAGYVCWTAGPLSPSPTSSGTLYALQDMK